jgi:hypothetical protein
MSGAAGAARGRIQLASFSRPELICVGCGCTELRACVLGTDELDAPITCGWVAVDEESGRALCSHCAAKPLEQWIEEGAQL